MGRSTLALAAVGFSLASSAHVYAKATYDRWAPIVPNITVRLLSNRSVLLFHILVVADHVLPKTLVHIIRMGRRISITGSYFHPVDRM